MRVSRNWLSRYVKIRMEDNLLAEKLTMAGLEVEGVESQSESLAGILVGEVRSVERHPGADRLSVCRVFNGKEEFQVVCGAPNVAAGQKVAFAPVGATVPKNQHDPSGGTLTIGRVKIRNVESSGMICSGYELGLSDDRDGILVLDSRARAGTLLSVHLGLTDSVFEIGVTANRPDLLSHIGVAREISALTGSAMKIPNIRSTRAASVKGLPLTVRVLDRERCPRYSARIVTDITVGPSPEWLRKLLTAAGIRPINNVVDVTNYVLMEIGQPLHAFDYDKIGGNAIVVRRGKGDQPFTTLDGKKRIVDDETLLICDGNGPVALAGVMGGENSEISDSTRTVVLESAYFTPAGIRRTSKRLGLSTEASQRFERGTDPNVTVWALDRATELLAETAGGRVQGKVFDLYPVKVKPRKVSLNLEKSNQLLGISLTEKRVSALLKRIGIVRTRSAPKTAGISYSVPTWRPDITRGIDLTEEIARLHGYDNIEAEDTIRITLNRPEGDAELPDLLRGYLSAAGYQEVVTNSMREPSSISDGGVEPVRIANPISSEMAVLRTDLLQSMLTVIKHNIFNGITSSRFFEIGKVYTHVVGGDPETLTSFLEEERLMVALFGDENPVFWGAPSVKSSIFTLKVECNALLGKFSLDNPVYIPYSNPTALSERSIFIEMSGERVGMIGTVSAKLMKQFDLETEIHFMDLSLERLGKFSKPGLKYKEYSRYPTVLRDVAFVVDEGIPIGEIEERIRTAAGEILGAIVLFDIYRGDQVEPGKKSCAFSLEFVPREKTLDQQEIQSVMRRVTESVTSAFHAVLRQ